MKTKNIIIIAIVTLLIGLIFGLMAGYSYAKVTKLKGITQGTGTPTGFDNISIQGLRFDVPQTEFPVQPATQTTIGNGLATVVVSGSFKTGTTTLIVLANPFQATSTITFASISGQNGTTSADILMGTTTAITFTSTSTAVLNQQANLDNSSLLAQTVTNNSQVSPTLINAAGATYKIASSTQFFLTAGVTSGPGTGSQNNAGTGSMASIIVGPKENIVVLATSTSASFSVPGNLGITTALTGTYVVEWQR